MCHGLQNVVSQVLLDQIKEMKKEHCSVVSLSHCILSVHIYIDSDCGYKKESIIHVFNQPDFIH